MCYLSRTPNSNPKPNPNPDPDHPPQITFSNSIFSVCEADLFQEICIINVPNTSQTIQTRDDDDDSDEHPNPCQTTAWEWFAFHEPLTQLEAVAVPRSPSSTTTQLFGNMEDRYLCARVATAPPPRAALCVYMPEDNSWHDFPKMQCEHRNPIAAAAAIVDKFLYLAGGYEGNSTRDKRGFKGVHSSKNFLPLLTRRNNSGEMKCGAASLRVDHGSEGYDMLNLLLISTRQSGFNLSTGEWQALPSMQKARAFATGIAHKGKFYVFGGATPKHSAEIYDPLSNTWLSIDSFVPEEADGFAVTSTFMNLVILTWSDRLGLKLWLRVEKSNEALENGTWTIVSDLPNNEEVDRLRFRHHGAKMMKLGNEVCVLMGETDCVWRVGGPVAWPIFPSPNFCPGGGHEVVHDGETYAFSIQADGTRFA